MGDAYAALDSHVQAVNYYKASLVTGEGDAEYLSNTYLQISKLLQKEKNYESAFEYLKRYNAFRDSTFTLEKLRTIQELNTRYETDQKDQQLALLLKDKQIQREILARQAEQIAKDKALAREQKLLLQNTVLENERKKDALGLQALEIENNRIKSKDQQITLANTATQLKIERQQQSINAATIRNQRNWLIFLLVGFVVLSLIGYLFFNRLRLLKKIHTQAALNLQRQQISRDLHDEVGATLSGIAMYSHFSRDQLRANNQSGIEQSLQIMQESSSHMVEKLNEIVWFINPEQDGLNMLINRLEDYASKMASIKKMRVNVTVSPQMEQVELNIDVRRNLYLFCKEAINNAVKYSGAHELRLTVVLDKGLLEFIVSDDGVGFNPAETTVGNGLKNMQARAAAIQGVYQINSEKGKGTSVALSIPVEGI
jgi:signal transduction histidine kinase